jgi:hypothetical protein
VKPHRKTVPRSFAAAAGTLAIASVFAVQISGCSAQTIQGNVQSINVDSEPSGAVVTVDGDYRLTTPATATFARRDDHTLVFHKDGFRDVTVQLTRSSSGWVLGSAFFGGALGVFDAYHSGAAYNLDNENLSGDNLTLRLTPDLKPAAAASTAAAP